MFQCKISEIRQFCHSIVHASVTQCYSIKVGCKDISGYSPRIFKITVHYENLPMQ